MILDILKNYSFQEQERIFNLIERWYLKEYKSKSRMCNVEMADLVRNIHDADIRTSRVKGPFYRSNIMITLTKVARQCDEWHFFLGPLLTLKQK